MRPNPLRKLLDEGKPSIGTHTMVFWPGMVEIIGHTGIIDYVEFVAEYAPYDLEGLENFGRAVDLFDHMTAMIKIDQEPRTFAATRAIGSGIQNVLFADVRDADETRECVGAVRAETPQTGGHHGSGDRRFAGYFLESGSLQYVQALEDSVVALMIEKKEAVDNLDENPQRAGNRHGRLGWQRLLHEHREARRSQGPRRYRDPRLRPQEGPRDGHSAQGRD